MKEHARLSHLYCTPAGHVKLQFPFYPDLEAVAEQVLNDLGPCDILIFGAGGNSADATTDKEYYEPGDLDRETKSFLTWTGSGWTTFSG